MQRQRRISILASAALLAVAPLARALPPRYDHVVIVVLENINNADIVGNPAGAPYLSALAAQNASLAASYGFIHTSAPNYGELYAGAANGITDGGVPPAPFTT